MYTNKVKNGGNFQHQNVQAQETQIINNLLSKFSNLLHFFTCASAIGNFWSICLSVNTLIPLSYVGFLIGILMGLSMGLMIGFTF